MSDELFPIDYKERYEQLKKAVVEMRAAQKRYYKTPAGFPQKKEILINSKRLELQVDQMIA